MGRGRPAADEASADETRELGLDLAQFRREPVKLAATGLLRDGQGRSRALGTSDKLSAVDGPAPKSPTRGRVKGLPAHDVACFLPETEGGHSVISWMGSVGGWRNRQPITPDTSGTKSSSPASRAWAFSRTSSRAKLPGGHATDRPSTP